MPTLDTSRYPNGYVMDPSPHQWVIRNIVLLTRSWQFPHTPAGINIQAMLKKPHSFLPLAACVLSNLPRARAFTDIIGQQMKETNYHLLFVGKIILLLSLIYLAFGLWYCVYLWTCYHYDHLCVLYRNFITLILIDVDFNGCVESAKVPYNSYVSYIVDCRRKLRDKILSFRPIRFRAQSNHVQYSGAVFDGFDFEGTLLNEMLMELQYEKLHEVFGMLSHMAPSDFKTPADHREFLRGLNDVRYSWWHNDERQLALKRFLVRTYCVCQEAFANDNEQYHIHSDPVLRFPALPQKHFIGKTNRRGVYTPPLVTYDVESNILEQHVLRLNVSRWLSPQKIRCSLRSRLAAGENSDSIYSSFCDRLYIWSNNVDIPDYAELSWVSGYIPDIYTKYAVRDDEEYLRIFRSQVQQMRAIILQFVRTFLEISRLCRKDRNHYNAERSEFVADHMRSLEGTLLFLQGHDKAHVAEHMYRKYIHEFNRTFKGTTVAKTRTLHKLSSRRRISKDRDLKWNDNFQSESDYLPKCLYNMRRNIIYVAGACLTAYVFTIIAAFWKPIADIIQTYGWFNHRFEYVTDRIKHWSQFMVGKGQLSATDKIVAVEVAALVECLYHAYEGDARSVAWTAKTFLITRPEYVIAAIHKLDFCHLVHARAAIHPCFNYNGQRRECKVEHYNMIMNAIAHHDFEVDDIVNDYSRPYVEHQSMFDLGEIQSYLSTLINISGVRTLSDKEMRELNTEFAYINNVRKEASTKMQGLLKIVSVLGRVLFAFDPFDYEYQLFITQVLTIMDFTSSTVLKQHIGADRELMAQIIVHHIRACELNINPRMERVPNFAKTLYMNRFRELERLAKEATAMVRGTHNRVTPTMVTFFGPPKIGKTACTALLQQCLCRFENITYKPEMVYNYRGYEYWEGYMNQKFVVIDDMFKVLDMTARATEAATIIDMVNTSVYPLNMAFGDKGTAFFDSDYVLASSNLAEAGFDKDTFDVGITKKGALLRRMHIVLWRSATIEPDAKNNSFQVQQCELFPELVGQWLSMKQVAWLVKKHRDKIIANSIEYSYTDEELDEFLGLGRFAPEQPFQLPCAPPMLVPRKKTHLPVQEQAVDEILIQNTIGALPQEPVDEDWFAAAQALANVPVMPLEPQAGEGVKRKKTDWCPAPYTPEVFIHMFVKHLFTITPFNLSDEDVKIITRSISVFFLLVSLVTAGTFFYNKFYAIEDKKVEEMEQPDVPLDHVEPQAGSRDWFHETRALTKSARRQLNKQYKAKLLPRTRLKPQSNADNYEQSLINKVSKCVVHSYAQSETGHIQDNCTGFHLKEGIFVFPGHYLEKFRCLEDTMITIAWDSGRLQLVLPEDMFSMEDEDVYMFRVPTTGNLPPELFKYIWDDKTYADITPGAVMKLISRDRNNDAFLITLHRASPIKAFKYADDNNDTFSVEYALSYHGRTLPGHSGSPIAIEGPQGQVMIVGMHIGVSKPHGVAINLTKECFTDILTHFGLYFKPQSCEFPMQIAYTVPISESNFPARRSKLRPSKMFGWNGNPQYLPARLSPFTNAEGILINPLFLGMKKLRQEPTAHCEPDKEFAEYFKRLYPRSDGNLLSWDEALNGNTEREIRSIVYSTSCGYPYTLKPTKGKSPYIEITPDLHFAYQPAFLETLKSLDNDIRCGKDIDVMWATTLKDETRALAKVAAGKTRVFSTCPLHFLILMRVYFQDFFAYVQSKATTHPVSVGINAHSIEWYKLRERIVAAGGSVVSGDYANFDGNLIRDLLEEELELINWWYNDGEVNARARKMLWKHIHSSRNIAYNNVFDLVQGLPSGTPGTSIIGSIPNMRMLFTVLTKDLRLRSDQFQLAVYGDDNLIGSEYPNMRVSDIAVHIKRRFNMEYTHCSKAEVDPVDSIETITYLGRSFVKYRSIVHAPLDLTTIVESTYWGRGQVIEDEVVVATADSFFSELSHHPQDVFDEYVDKYYSALADRAPHLIGFIRNIQKEYFTYYERNYVNDGKKVNTSFSPQSGYSKSFVVNNPEQVETTQNTQFSERAVNVLVDTQINPLGAFQDAAPVTHTVANSETMQGPQSDMNLEAFEMDGALNREYKVASYTWSTSQAGNTSLGTIKFPDVLFANTFIANKINGFSMFKAGIRLSVRMTATKFVYGKIMVAFQPYANGLAVSGSLTQSSGSPHVIVSASASEAAVFDVPFVSPYRALDLQSYLSAEMGQFNVRVLHPLTDIQGNVNTAQIVITASFIDAKCYLPFEVQSGEAAKKGKTGVISGALDSVSSVASSMSNIPVVGEYARNLHRLTSAGSTISKMLGLSKPKTVQVGLITNPNSNFTINLGKGIETVATMGMDQENAISTIPNVGGISADEMAFKYIVGTPMLINSPSWVSGTSAGLICSTTRTDININFVDAVSQFFLYTAGSYKFKIYITASLMHAVRGVFYLANDATDDWQNCHHRIVDIIGDSEVEFAVPYCSKYVSRRQTQSTAIGVYFAILSWSQPTPAATAPIYFAVYKAGGSDFQFGALKDMCFQTQSNPREDFNKEFDFFHPTMKGYKQDKLLFGEEYETVRECIHKYTCYGSAAYSNVYGPAHDGGSSSVIPTYNTQRASGFFIIGMEMWGLMFRFWRGSVRMKFIGRESLPSAVLRVNGTLMNTMILPTTTVIRSLAGSGTICQLDMEVPYYHNVLFEQTLSTPENTVVVDVTNNSTPEPNVILCKAAGDDFSYHWLVAPPDNFLNPTYFTTSVSPIGPTALQSQFAP